MSWRTRRDVLADAQKVHADQRKVAADDRERVADARDATDANALTAGDGAQSV